MKVDQAVGQRIARAREFLGLTQAAVAQRMDLARTTQVAVEQGQRAVSVAELQQYGEILGRPLSYFFAEGVWEEDADFRALFLKISERLKSAPEGQPRRPGRPRGLSEAPVEKRALATLEVLCRQYVDLRRLNDVEAPRMWRAPFFERPTVQDAEHLAGAVRAFLDVGVDAPLRDLRAQLEHSFGVSAFVLPDLGRLEATAFRHPRAGVCVLFAPAPPARLRFSLARALGYLLVGGDDALVQVAGVPQRGPSASFANAFAAALLMPGPGLRRLHASQSLGREPLAPRVAHLARFYGVEPAELRQRLQSQRLLVAGEPSERPPAAAEYDPGVDGASRGELLASGGGSWADACVALGSLPPAYLVPPLEPPWQTLPEGYAFLAARSYRRGLIDAARLGECLLASERAALEWLARYEGSATTP